MCLIEHDNKLLVNKGFDSIKNQIFYRLVGGKIEFGEEMEDTVRREIQEELESDIINLEFITTNEELFVYEGKKGHEINFLFRVTLAREDIYERDIIPNPDSEDFPAVWINISDIVHQNVILYPSFDYKKIFSKRKNI